MPVDNRMPGPRSLRISASRAQRTTCSASALAETRSLEIHDLYGDPSPRLAMTHGRCRQAWTSPTIVRSRELYLRSAACAGSLVHVAGEAEPHRQPGDRALRLRLRQAACLRALAHPARRVCVCARVRVHAHISHRAGGHSIDDMFRHPSIYAPTH